MNTNITFLINKSEITAGTRGASLGPDAIMTAARQKGSYIFSDNKIEEIRNWNELLNRPIKYPYAKRIIGLLNVYEELNAKVSSLVKSNTFPIVLAADHGSAGGTISGIKSAFPDKRIGVVWIDAHADIHTPYTTPSGNLHGMPLASVLDIDNKECKINDIDAETEEYWNKLKNVGGFSKKINTEDLVYVGVRDTEAGEEFVIEKFGIKSIEVGQLRKEGVTEILKDINEQLKDCDIIYVSFDVDSMDPDLTSYGTGTPVPGGITPNEAKELLTHFAANPKTVCIEVVEVNPCLDEKKNKMAEVTLDLLEAITDVVKERA
ncbi:arginase [Flavobacterium okayamense]|uniref:Arginase n=1 Tax=Flavobacterium okayamense TaxID=2830782 RepID=A0ABM7S269_9FLAO|nr:arginase [Flavobacterium okayamense]BCY27292.1 arginase [Flavobacterium okayamense]